MASVGAFNRDAGGGSRRAVAPVGDATHEWSGDEELPLAPVQLHRLAAAAETIGRVETVEQIAATLVDEGVAAVRGSRGAVVLLDGDGTHLQVVAYSGYDRRIIPDWQRFPLNVAAPLADAVRTRRVVVVPSVEEFARRYPGCQPLDHEPHALVAVPLFHGAEVIGGWGVRLDVDASGAGAQVTAATAASEYLGGLASSGISSARDRGVLEERVRQLQGALVSRVAIEQAKGMLAERHGIGTQCAFDALRSYARGRGARLHEVAAAVVAGDVDPLA